MYNSLSYKTKQFFWLMIKLSIVIGCTYFIYKRLTENNELSFSVFYSKLMKNDVLLVKNLVILLLFTLFNWFLEITKWHLLISFIGNYSFKQALAQSLSSLTASLITPNRIGEYGAKAIYFEKHLRKQIVGLNLIGNFYQMLATIFFGGIFFCFFVFKFNIEIDFYRIFRFIIIGVFVVTVFFFGTKYFKFKGNSYLKVREFIKKTPSRLNLKIAFLSFLRFIVFSHQFYFLIFLFNIEISYIDAITAISTVYFISSIIPMLSVFDVVIKGTIALWVFSFLKVDTVTILTITTFMWALNFVLPAIFGSYFVLIFKPLETK